MKAVKTTVLLAFVCLSTACGGNSPEARMALIREAIPHWTAALNATDAAQNDKKYDAHLAEFKAAVEKLKPIRVRAQKMDSPSENDRKKIQKSLNSELLNLHNRMYILQQSTMTDKELGRAFGGDPVLMELVDTLDDIAGPNPHAIGHRRWW